jgi:hypothetical protein
LQGLQNDAGMVFFRERASENAAATFSFPAGTAEFRARVVFFRAGAPENHASVSFLLQRLLKFVHGQLFHIQR